VLVLGLSGRIGNLVLLVGVVCGLLRCGGADSGVDWFDGMMRLGSVYVHGK
jgi:hypothetical protein